MKSPAELLTIRRVAILNRAKEDRAKRRHKWEEQIAVLAEKLTLTVALDSPAEGERVRWTELEIDALAEAATKLRTEATFIDWVGSELSDAAKSSAGLVIMKQVIERVLPAHRQRKIMGLSQLPINRQEQFYRIFNLTRPTETATEPAADPVIPAPPKQVQWTDQEGKKLITHLAHLMRKQGLRAVPDSTDPLGREMFADFTRRAQDLALPRHRHKVMVLPRQVLENSFLMPLLEPMLRLPQLPPLPHKDLEIDEIMAQQGPKSETNGNGRSHDHAALLTGGAFREMPAQPEQAPIAAPEPADLTAFRDELNRALHQMEKRVLDAEQFCNLLTEENTAINEREAGLRNRLTELEERVKALSTEADRFKIPRVAILGCLKDEFEQVKKLSADRGLKLDFRYYEQTGGKEVEVFADYAVCMMGVSHGQMAKVRNAIPAGQYTFIPKFSVNRTVAQLMAWFQSESVSNGA